MINYSVLNNNNNNNNITGFHALLYYLWIIRFSYIYIYIINMDTWENIVPKH